ncbi:peptidylprolyl isomerase [Lutibaculum baratangense]|uniref:Parvulin-like PPIase n=1 Tax=Lutibaculum baratangense AMV1 TaxID=631454 RepID=V4TCR8_9HYPH|nr:peptidylprolyl isomerase [Lutibaculum baratangense]ESR24093.1 PpiC-type peptidyl-prolyl cis-trans isomerase [Lutibaculum baratangense AMV1]
MPHSARPFSLALGIAGALFVGGAALAQEQAAPAEPPSVSGEVPAGASEVIARLGDREITAMDVAIAAEDLAQTLQQLPAEQRDSYLLTYVADLERIAKAARETGIEDEEEFQRRLRYVTDRTLMEAYLGMVGDEAATDEAARDLYEQEIGQAEPQQELHARHILVPTEEEANQIKQQIDEGGDFAALAAEHSKDPGSGQNGGDLGFFTPDQMVPEFAQKAQELEPGEVSDPVQTQFGWHVIKLEDRRDQEKPDFEQVEEQLKSALARQAQRDLIMSLREGSQIEVVGQDGADPANAETDAAPEGDAASENASGAGGSQ